MTTGARDFLVRKYTGFLREHGRTPEGVGSSPEGQRFRFAKLAEIADLRGRTVLDLGCGLGAFYPFLVERFGALDYTGVDIVPEAIESARAAHPGARFLVADLLSQDFAERFDYVLLSGLFNYKVPGETSFLEPLLGRAFPLARLGLGFNFLSTHHNFAEPEMEYHDPARVLEFCVRELSPRVALHHHYERCDVAVFVYATETP